MASTRYLRLLIWVTGIALTYPAARLSADQTRDRRVVFATVADTRGKIVSGLGAANFRGELRGQPITIVSVTESPAPRHVAIMVDVSGSQIGSIQREWTQAAQLIDALVPRASIAVFTVNGKIAKYFDLTTDRGVIHGALRDAARHVPDGPSSLYDAVIEVADTLRGLSTGDVICLISDGVDDSSRRSMTNAALVLARKGVRMFLVGQPVNDPMDRTRRLPTTAAWGAMARTIGGLTTSMESFTPNLQEIGGVTSFVAAAMLDCYRVEFTTAVPVDTPRNWTLDVTSSDGRPLKDARVLSSHMLLSADSGHAATMTARGAGPSCEGSAEALGRTWHLAPAPTRVVSARRVPPLRSETPANVRASLR